MQKIIIKNKTGKRILSGYQWIFSNEINNVIKTEPGIIVDVFTESGKSLGKAFYNPHSLIALRLLNTNTFPDLNFFKDRIKRANKLREDLYPKSHIYRMVFGESDFLPGLIIDRFTDYFSIQHLSAGMDNFRKEIVSAIIELYPKTKGIIEKNNSSLRISEGLEAREKTTFGSIPETIECRENGIKLSISLKGGQKTGYYLDQRDNRLLVRNISKGMAVLDCFTNLGGFALNAAKSGAVNVLGIDSSEKAIKSARHNAILNNLKNVKFERSDVFEFLENEFNKGKKWDVIILDPPAFAKTKKSIPSAKIGYLKLNNLALKCLKSDSYLVTSSCSGHLREDVFLELINKAAGENNHKLRLVYRGGQSPDHPVIPAMPETNYLKFFIFRVNQLS